MSAWLEWFFAFLGLVYGSVVDWFLWFNSYAWIFSNLLIAYIGVVLIIFVVGYWLLFDPKATTGGRLIFRFAVSLVGVIGLVFVSLFVNPASGRAWDEYPGDLFWWRPVVRLIVYSYVAYTITSLTILLGIRKWKPHIIVVAPDESSLVRVRTRTQQDRKTKK